LVKYYEQQLYKYPAKYHSTVKKRLERLMSASVELKFLVGFFYFSGWQEIYRSLKENDKITLKVLVGLQVDAFMSGIVEYGTNDENIVPGHEEQFARFMKSLGKAINNADMDTETFYSQLDFLIQMLQVIESDSHVLTIQPDGGISHGWWYDKTQMTITMVTMTWLIAMKT